MKKLDSKNKKSLFNIKLIVSIISLSNIIEVAKIINFIARDA
jgi:hypothetical protein